MNTLINLKTTKDSNEVYHSSDAISASGLKKIFKKSVYHFLNQKPFESSSMALGTAIHTAILEPDNFYKDYHVFPKIDRRTKAGKEMFEAETKKAADKILLAEEDHEKIKAILENYRANETAVKYCQGEVEVSHYGSFEGADVRVRPDVKNAVAGFISDIKTCQDNSPQAFLKDVYKYAYHLQAAFYSDALGFDPLNFRFVAIETNYPFSVEVYALSKEMIEKGRNAYMKALSDWKLYKATGIVSGYNSENRTKDGSIIL